MTFNTQRYTFFVKQKKKSCYILLIIRRLDIIQQTLIIEDNFHALFLRFASLANGFLLVETAFFLTFAQNNIKLKRYGKEK